MRWWLVSEPLVVVFINVEMCGQGSLSLDTSQLPRHRVWPPPVTIHSTLLCPPYMEFRQTDPSLDNESLNRLETSLHWFDLPTVLGVWSQHWYSGTMSEHRIRWAVQENRRRLGDCSVVNRYDSLLPSKQCLDVGHHQTNCGIKSSLDHHESVQC